MPGDADYLAMGGRFEESEEMDERERKRLGPDKSPTPEQVCDCSAQQQDNAHMPQTGYHDDDCAWMPFAIEDEEHSTPTLVGDSVLNIIEGAAAATFEKSHKQRREIITKTVAECFGRFVDLHGSNMTSEPIEDMQTWIAQLRGEK